MIEVEVLGGPLDGKIVAVEKNNSYIAIITPEYKVSFTKEDPLSSVPITKVYRVPIKRYKGRLIADWSART